MQGFVAPLSQLSPSIKKGYGILNYGLKIRFSIKSYHLMEESKYKIKVYKIWYEDAPDEIYIGSTKESRLSNRMTWHRSSAKSGVTKLLGEKEMILNTVWLRHVWYRVWTSRGCLSKSG